MYWCVQQATDDRWCRERARLIFRCKQGWRQCDGSRMLLQLIAANFVYLAVKTVLLLLLLSLESLYGWRESKIWGIVGGKTITRELLSIVWYRISSRLEKRYNSSGEQPSNEFQQIIIRKEVCGYVIDGIHSQIINGYNSIKFLSPFLSLPPPQSTRLQGVITS